MTYVHVALKTLKLVSNTQMHDAWQRANFLVVHTSTDTLTLLKSYKALSQHIPIYIAKSLGVFFSFFFMDTTCGTGSAYLFWAHATTHVFYGVRVAQSLNSYVVFYALLLLLWLFFVGFFFCNIIVSSFSNYAFDYPSGIFCLTFSKDATHQRRKIPFLFLYPKSNYVWVKW